MSNQASMKKMRPLRIMKFGGTSVGNASCISALFLAQVTVVAMFEGASGCSVSVVVAGKDKTAALVALHREFQLCEVSWPALSADSSAVAAAAPFYQSERAPADGD